MGLVTNDICEWSGEQVAEAETLDNPFGASAMHSAQVQLDAHLHAFWHRAACRVQERLRRMRFIRAAGLDTHR